jgi:DNA-binding response OmpR family regulator
MTKKLAVTRIELLNDVWGLKYDVGGNLVDAVVAALRKNLGRPGWGN